MAVAIFVPERPQLVIGYMPLADAVPLLWAQQRGHFEAFGLDVRLAREVSWASLRDRLAYGALDAAQCLGPMPLAATLGIDGVGISMVSAIALSRGGSQITLSRSLAERLGIGPMTPPAESAAALGRYVAAGAPLRLGHVFPFSMHHYLMREWLVQGGAPASHIAFPVAPPPQMVRLLEAGELDGFCVGEPWNTVARQGGLGVPLVATRSIWNAGPEKVLGVTRDWALRYPQTHRALVSALLCAQSELAAGVAPDELAALFRDDGGVSMPEKALIPLFEGKGLDAPEFSPRHAALRPSQMMWCLMQMILLRQCIKAVQALEVCESVCDNDCLRDAAHAVGVPISAAANQVEGASQAPTVGEASCFLGGAALDPEQPAQYLLARGMSKASVAERLNG